MASAPSTQTSYDDVVTHFAGRSERAARLLAEWRADSHKAAVVPWVEAAVTTVAYTQPSALLLSVAEQTEHALGEIKKSSADEVISVRDWHPAFAFQHVFHYATESLRSVPTYQQLRAFVVSDTFAQEMLLHPARRARDQALADGWPRARANDSVRWRVANAYYSYLKEVYSLAVLREAGIDALYHVLADALFRTDLWVGDLCLSLFVSNRVFKSEVSGRKPRAEEVLGDGPFKFVHLEMATRHEFGTVHLPDPEGLVELVRSQL